MLSVNIRQFNEVIKFTIEKGLKQAILGLGAPGIGKSEIIQQTAKDLGYRVVDLRLAQMSEVEIGGLIYPSEDKTYTNWLRPNWFPTGNEGQPTVLLLDELTSATKRVQVAAYQLVLDRRIGEHVLPDDTVIIALGNREDDGGVYVELAAPLANRFEIYDVECDANIWLEDYAYKYVDGNGRGVNPLVSSYIKEHPSRLHTQSEDSEEIIFASPRSWKRVSDTLNAANNQISDVVKRKILASIGDELGSQFIMYVDKYATNTVVEQVLAGQEVDISEDRGDILYIIDAFTSRLNEMSKNGDSMQDCATAYNRMCNFANKFPAEFETMCITQLSAVNSDIVAAAMRTMTTDKFADTLSDLKKEEEALTNLRTIDGFGDNTPSDVVNDTSANFSFANSVSSVPSDNDNPVDEVSQLSANDSDLSEILKNAKFF